MELEKKNLTIPEAAQVYGISTSTLYKLSAKREIPILKIGEHKVLIPIAEFEEWLKKYQVGGR